MRKLVLIVFVFATTTFSQVTNDIIEPITVFTGGEKSVKLSDLFYAENYAVQILPNENLSAELSRKDGMLILKPKNDKRAFAVLRLATEKDTLAAPIIIKRNYPVVFKFPAKEEHDFVSVFGSFNDWNRKEYRMKKKGEFYETVVFVRPGNYQYKFFVDGKEYCDPFNSDSVGNGMGGFNSVLEVKSETKGKIFLHKNKFERGESETAISFFIESENDENISESEIYAFLDNKLLSENEIERAGNFVKITIPNSEMARAKRLRAVAELGGRISNIQNVFLENGKLKTVRSAFDWRRGVIYSLMIDRFFDGDKSNSIPLVHDSLFAKANYMGGDLQGIMDKLDEGYFDSLDVNILWISPVYDNPNVPYREYPPPHRWFAGYHGYWPINSFAVDEHFGSLELLKKLVEKAHAHGIKVLLDFVSNHVHIENPLYIKHRDWFGSLYLPDGRKNIRFWDEYRLTTWFEPYLPSFDYVGSDEATEFMTENALWWLEQTGADGFRHDAVKHVPNKFWRRLTRKLNERGFGDAYQIGETFGSDMLVSSYVNNGQLDAQFNFNLYNTALETFLDTARSFENLLRELETTFSYYGENNLMGNIMDSHDKNRFTAFADGDLTLEQWSATEEGWNNPPKVDNPETYRKAELYYAYLFAIPGVPVIYYGSEFGMSGASDPDNRRMMRFGEQLSADEKKMLAQTREIVKLRREHSALNYGDFYPLIADKNTFAFIRSDFNERVLVVMNKNFDKSRKVKIKLPDFISASKIKDLRTGDVLSVRKNGVEIILEPLAWKYFVIE